MLVSSDALQVYRGLPILTNQPSEPTRLVGHLAPRPGGVGRGVRRRSPTRRSTRSLAAGRTPVVVGGTGLYLRAALAELALPPALRRPASGSGGRRSTTPSAGAAHARLAELDPVAAAAVHPNDRRRVVRALELAEVGASLAAGRGPALGRRARGTRRSSSASTCRSTCSSGGSRSGRAPCSTPASGRRCAARSQAPSRPRRGRRSGSRRWPTLPREEAIAALVVRTRRYAAYQRKWMRRIPGIVMVEADRPPGEIADDIVALARSRERLPRR